MRGVFGLGLDAAVAATDDDELQRLRGGHVNSRIINFRQHAPAQREPDLRFECVRGADALLAGALPMRVPAGRAGRVAAGAGLRE